MRWLAVLAIVIAGAAVYLKMSLSNGETEPSRDRPSRPAPEADAPATSAPVAPAPIRETRPAPAPKDEPAKVSEPTKPIDRIAQVLAPTDAGVIPDAEETPWTEEEAAPHLFAVSGRYEKGNYPGTIAKAMEVARRYPKWQEDAWKWAIQAHCAMENADKANELFVKMTDQTAIEEISKTCTTWGVKLKPPRK